MLLQSTVSGNFMSHFAKKVIMDQTADAVKVDAVVGAAPAIELALQTALSSTLQPVQDEMGTSSVLNLATERVAIGTADSPCTFYVTGNYDSHSVARVRSTGNEASIEFKIIGADEFFHLGSKIVDGANRFFLWQADVGDLLDIRNKTVTVNGTLVADALKINGSTGVKGILPAANAPQGVNLETVMVDPKTGKLYYQ